MATLDTFQSIFFSRLHLSQQSRITQQVGITVLAGHVLKNCTRYRIIRLFRMLKKVQLIWMGHPNVCRSVISLYSLLRKSNDHHWQRVLCFNSRLSYHIIPQVVRSFNVTWSQQVMGCYATLETWKFYLPEEQFFLNGNHETATKSLKRGILEECLLSFRQVTV